MKKTLKSCLVLLMCVAMVLSWTLPAGAITGQSQPAQTTNLGAYEYAYNRWASPIRSHLIPNADGTLTRVEYTGEVVAVERYDSNYNFLSGFTLEPELELYGGFYSGSTYNFLVFGQLNDAEDDNAEVLRIVCYTKDWVRVGSASLYGANTTTPFRGGTVRFAEYNGYLYIRTSHEMYTSADGRRHQSNLMINLRIADLKITDSFSRVMNSNYGYVSHSFNQFVAVDGKDLLAVDHGDAHPRSVVLFRYHAPAGQDSFMKGKIENYKQTYVKQVNVLNIQGQSGLNDTGVALGGFEISNSAYLIVGNTVSQEPGCDLFGQRNIFISVTSKSDFSENGTTLRYLTNYAEGDNVEVSNPHFVKISDNRFALLWTETTGEGTALRYCFVNGQGNLQGQIHTAQGVLSDCQPVVVDGQLIWYATSASGPAFFSIDLDDPQNSAHQHIYNYDYMAYPWYDYDGALYSFCAVCGEMGPEVAIPALKNTDAYTLMSTTQEPTCTEIGYGYYRWNDVDKYHVTDYYYGYDIPALGHDWVEGDCETPKTCGRCGQTQAVAGHEWMAATCTEPETCAVCGQTRGEPAAHEYVGQVTQEPDCTTAGEQIFTCTGCGHRYTEALEPLGHAYEASVTAPDCVNGGYTTHTCTRCGDSFVDSETQPTGHSYDDGVITGEPGCTEPGQITYTCSCGHRYTQALDPTGHSYGPATVYPPTPTEQGYTEEICEACGYRHVYDFTTYGTATLSGRLTSYLADTDVTLELLRDGRVVRTLVLSGGESEYCFENLEPGSYTLRLTKKNHAPVELAVEVGTENVTQDAKLCPVGDITGDGAVNIKDFQRLLRHINKTNLLSEDMLSRADVTGEGSVNIKDFQRMLRHINKTNPLF